MLNTYSMSLCVLALCTFAASSCGTAEGVVDPHLMGLTESALEALDDPSDDLEPEDAEIKKSEGWSLTDDLHVPRADHVAVRLKSGKVLVVGGLRITDPSQPLPPPNEALSATEVYDPRSGRWTSVGRLAVPRGDSHAAVRLRSGEVLVVGGSSTHGETNDASQVAEIFDPRLGTWSMVGQMTEPRLSMSATLLQSGKVLIAGGYFFKGNEFRRLKTAELYDPATRTFTKTGDMVVGRDITVATRLFDGRVLVMGSGDSETPEHSAAEIYDPRTQTWSATDSLRVGRNYHQAVLLRSGKVLVVGGFSKLDKELSTELFDPKTEQWSVQGPLVSGRGLFGIARLRSGKVLVGGDGFETNAVSTEIYDPRTGTWSLAAPLVANRGDLTFTLLPNGKVLAAGGVTYFTDDKGTEHADTSARAELYAPAPGGVWESQ